MYIVCNCGHYPIEFPPTTPEDIIILTLQMRKLKQRINRLAQTHSEKPSVPQLMSEPVFFPSSPPPSCRANLLVELRKGR